MYYFMFVFLLHVYKSYTYMSYMHNGFDNRSIADSSSFGILRMKWLPGSFILKPWISPGPKLAGYEAQTKLSLDKDRPSFTHHWHRGLNLVTSDKILTGFWHLETRDLGLSHCTIALNHTPISRWLKFYLSHLIYLFFLE